MSRGVHKVPDRILREASAPVSLVKVTKRSKVFNKTKLKTSARKTGAKDAHSTEIADRIAGKVKPGTTTVVIRRWVIAELGPLDPRAAKASEAY